MIVLFFGEIIQKKSSSYASAAVLSSLASKSNNEHNMENVLES